MKTCAKDDTTSFKVYHHPGEKIDSWKECLRTFSVCIPHETLWSLVTRFADDRYIPRQINHWNEIDFARYSVRQTKFYCKFITKMKLISQDIQRGSCTLFRVHITPRCNKTSSGDQTNRVKSAIRDQRSSLKSKAYNTSRLDVLGHRVQCLYSDAMQ